MRRPQKIDRKTKAAGSQKRKGREFVSQKAKGLYNHLKEPK
jgi:hypothetical protein